MPNYSDRNARSRALKDIGGLKISSRSFNSLILDLGAAALFNDPTGNSYYNLENFRSDLSPDGDLCFYCDLENSSSNLPTISFELTAELQRNLVTGRNQIVDYIAKNPQLASLFKKAETTSLEDMGLNIVNGTDVAMPNLARELSDVRMDSSTDAALRLGGKLLLYRTLHHNKRMLDTLGVLLPELRFEQNHVVIETPNGQEMQTVSVFKDAVRPDRAIKDIDAELKKFFKTRQNDEPAIIGLKEEKLRLLEREYERVCAKPCVRKILELEKKKYDLEQYLQIKTSSIHFQKFGEDASVGQKIALLQSKIKNAKDLDGFFGGLTRWSERVRLNSEIKELERLREEELEFWQDQVMSPLYDMQVLSVPATRHHSLDEVTTVFTQYANFLDQYNLARPVHRIRTRSNDQVIVISDVHGDMVNLTQALEEITRNPRGSNIKIVFNGDMIDRGTESIEILARLFTAHMKLVRAGASPDCITFNMGNHEFFAAHGTRNCISEYGFVSELARLLCSEQDSGFTIKDYVQGDKYGEIPRNLAISNFFFGISNSEDKAQCEEEINAFFIQKGINRSKAEVLRDVIRETFKRFHLVTSIEDRSSKVTTIITHAGLPYTPGEHGGIKALEYTKNLESLQKMSFEELLEHIKSRGNIFHIVEKMIQQRLFVDKASRVEEYIISQYGKELLRYLKKNNLRLVIGHTDLGHPKADALMREVRRTCKSGEEVIQIAQQAHQVGESNSLVAVYDGRIERVIAKSSDLTLGADRAQWLHRDSSLCLSAEDQRFALRYFEDAASRFADIALKSHAPRVTLPAANACVSESTSEIAMSLLANAQVSDMSPIGSPRQLSLPIPEESRVLAIDTVVALTA